MATAKKQQAEIEEEKKISATEQFYNQYKKAIWGTIIAVLAVFLCVLGYSKFIYAPACAQAQEAAYPAEINFQAGEFQLALEGDGNVLGFEDICSQYGAKAGKAVYLYAGICNLQLGNNEQAIKYLKKYNGKDTILAARALACIGDAMVNLDDVKGAVAYFEKAAAKGDNVFAAAYLLKAGVCYEALGNNAKALACYKQIKDKYPQSFEAYDIDKNIAKVSE